MFKHPGKQVKFIAIVLLVLSVLIGAGVGLVLGAILASAGSSGGVFGPGAPIGAASLALFPVYGGVIGLIVGGINAIMIFAFGALVDDMETVRTALTGLCMDVSSIRRRSEGAGFGAGPTVVEGSGNNFPG